MLLLTRKHNGTDDAHEAAIRRIEYALPATLSSQPHGDIEQEVPYNPAVQKYRAEDERFPWSTGSG